MSTEWKLVPAEPTPEMSAAGFCVDEGHDPAGVYRAMLAAAPQHPSSVSQWPAWQPIETAPRDGTALLLWEEASIHPFVGWWAMGGWHVSHEHVDAEGGWDGAVVVDRLIMPITHWMPLPPDPGEAAQPADVAWLAWLVKLVEAYTEAQDYADNRAMEGGRAFEVAIAIRNAARESLDTALDAFAARGDYHA